MSYQCIMILVDMMVEKMLGHSSGVHNGYWWYLLNFYLLSSQAALNTMTSHRKRHRCFFDAVIGGKISRCCVQNQQEGYFHVATLHQVPLDVLFFLLWQVETWKLCYTAAIPSCYGSCSVDIRGGRHTLKHTKLLYSKGPSLSCRTSNNTFSLGNTHHCHR